MTTSAPHPLHLPLIYSGPVRRGQRLMELAHRGARRKSGDVPYALHPITVAQLLAAAGATDEEIIAALLHDVPEDTDFTLLDIQDRFGYTVASRIASVTKVDEIDGRKLTGAEKNEIVIATLTDAPIEDVAIKAGDLIGNLSDLIFDRREHGPDHWRELFGAKTDQKIAHYLRLASLLSSRLAGTRFELLSEILADRAGTIHAMHEGGSYTGTTGVGRRVPLIYSARVRRALWLAEHTYRGQDRKGTDVPFLLHPVAVAQILAAVSDDDDLLCAGYLEDAVGRGLDFGRIEDEFGRRTASLVEAVTPPFYSGGRRTRGDEKDFWTVQAMSSPDADPDVQALKAADAIANISDLVLDHVEHGPEHWTRLFGDKLDAKLTYYATLADVLASALEGHERYAPLAGVLRGRADQLARLR